VRSALVDEGEARAEEVREEGIQEEALAEKSLLRDLIGDRRIPITT